MSAGDKKLRFCMISTFYPPYNFGGDGLYVWLLSNELARRGHSVTVIHCLDSYAALAGDNRLGAMKGEDASIAERSRLSTAK